jgi:hypothetical protein
MTVDQSAQHIAHRLKQLAGEFTGWRIGRGGSGHWWAVRGNDLIRTPDVEELAARLREQCAEKITGNLAENSEIVA